MQIPLTDGTYQARSVIASAQRCVNLYPEVNDLNRTMYMPQQQTNSIITHYPTPGLTLLSTIGTGPIRGAYTASNNVLYVVSGSGVYSVAANWSSTLLGTIGTGNTPVSMADNAITLVIVDGTPNGYTIDLATSAFAPIVDAAFYGADWVDYIDTFFLFNKPGTQQFYSTTSEVVTPFDPLYFAGKVAKPDLLVAPVVMHDEIWLIGEQTTEIWYNSGDPAFPFAKVPGAFIQHGCMAKHSIAVQNLQIYWLSQNAQGERVVLCGSNYQVDRISTHAIEADIAAYADCSDAIGFIYQQQGHQFYQLTFPSAQKTWVYDTQTSLWHERMFLKYGVEMRHRANCCATYQGQNVVGDWENGNLYSLDPNNYTDNGAPIERIRGFPTLQNELKRVMYSCFRADMEPGKSKAGGPVVPQVLTDGFGNPVEATEANGLFEIETNAVEVAADGSEVAIGLRWSDTGGQSWSDIIYQSLGHTGQFQTQPQWRRLGMGRRRVFELRWSASVQTALNCAYVDITQAAS